MKRFLPSCLSACIHLCLIGALSFISWESVPQEMQTYELLWVEKKEKKSTSKKLTKQKRGAPSLKMKGESAKPSQAGPSSGSKSYIPPLRKSYKPLPSYPWACRKRGHEGVVAVFIRTDEGGKVIEAKIQNSSGYELLDEAALKAVQQWVLAEGPVQKTFSIVFRLNG